MNFSHIQNKSHISPSQCVTEAGRKHEGQATLPLDELASYQTARLKVNPKNVGLHLPSFEVCFTGFPPSVFCLHTTSGAEEMLSCC